MVYFLGNKEDKDFGMTLSSDLTQTRSDLTYD
jgi:hypothetical protein